MKEIINGTEIHYMISGTGKRRVLLLHGWGCDMKMMQPVAETLENDHQVLLVDFPGHGESGRPPVPWGVPEYAQALTDLLTRLEYTPCAVIAHSFGCRVAAWIAAHNPDAFDKMVFTGAAGIRPKQTEESRRRSERYQRLKKCCEFIRHIPGLRYPAETMEEKLRKHFGSRDYNALDPEMRKTFVRVISQDLTELYERIQASTLLIWGDSDTETPLWMGKEMEKRIPDAGLVILEGGTHFAYLEQIRRFNTIVSHFLKGDE